MIGIIVLILIGLGGLGYLAILFLGTVGVTVSGLTKKKPPEPTAYSEEEFLSSIRMESDYKSDEEFLRFLPPNSSSFSLKEKISGYYDSIIRSSIVSKEISRVLNTIYCPNDCGAARALIGKMIEVDYDLYSAMLREEKAAKDWMDKNNKCYYPVSYMVRTFKKYGVTEKLNELAKIGCSIPDDLRPYAPGRESNESSLMWRRQYQQEKASRDYTESKAQATEGLWLIIGFLGLIGSVALWWYLASIDHPFLAALLGLIGVIVSLTCAIYGEASGAKVRHGDKDNNKDDIYPGL